MIRRRTFTAQQQALRDYKQAAPISTGEPRAEVKARADAEEAAVIQAVHDWIWTHRPAWCQLCHGMRRADCAGLPDQMHEEPSRAQTQGLPPGERFNHVVCGRLCAACHQDVTERRLRIVFANPADGFMGSVRSEPWPT